MTLDPSPPQRSRLLWGVVLSILLHLLLLVAALTLLPAIARRFAGPEPVISKPEVLTFRFRDRTAEVDASSRVDKPPDTPLTGRIDSQARDRVRDSHDTPVPSGAIVSTENALPGRDAPSEGTSQTPTGAADAAAGRQRPVDSGAGIADAIGSEVSMLTGKREEVARRRGRGPRTDAEAGENGAMQFGDFSFSTRAWDYEPYWVYMRERLYANWHPPAAYEDYGIIRGGWTMVRAVLDRQGHLLNARIIGENGHESLHPASFAAMLGAAPFRPLPADFPEDSLVVTVRFIYLPPGETPPSDRP
jgi:hypothetical protein